MELKGKIINFLGDSITEGVGTSCDEAKYIEVLKREAGLAEVRNYGIGGTRIAEQGIDCNGWLDERDFCRRYKTMDKNADVIVVFGGTNDYDHGDADFGTRYMTTPKTYYGAVNYLMRGLIEMYPTATIVFMTPMQRLNLERLNSRGYTLKMYVDAIKEAGERFSIPVLDLYGTLGICPDVPCHLEAYCPDGLHPNDAGNEKIARRLKAFLESL